LSLFFLLPKSEFRGRRKEGMKEGRLDDAKNGGDQGEKEKRKN
jgi:hypothetical protein